MGTKIERSLDLAFGVTAIGLRTGRALIKGAYTPVTYTFQMEKEAWISRSLKDGTMGALPIFAPAALGLAGLGIDYNFLIYLGGGIYYIEGAGISFIQEFLCPRDEKPPGQKPRLIDKIRHLSRFPRSKAS